MRSSFVVVVALVMASCVPQSRAQSCRMGVALGNINGKKSSAEVTLEEMRCDNIEAAETANEHARRSNELEARRQAAQEDAESARVWGAHARAVAQRRQADSEELASFRRRPNVPELGATPGEAKIACNRQRGEFHEVNENVGCLVAGIRTFACRVESELLVRCDAYYEDGDLVDQRTRIERALGPAKQEVHGGVRVFSWERGDELTTLKAYDRGVRVSHEKVAKQP